MKKRYYLIFLAIFLILDLLIFCFYLIEDDFFGKKTEVLPDYALENINFNENNVNVGTLHVTSVQIPGLGISLSLPDSFHIASGQDLNQDFFQAMTYDDTLPYDPNTLGVKVEILNFNNKNELPLIEWVGSSAYYQEGVPDFIETTLNENPALMQETITVSNASRTYVIGYNKKVYIIDFSGDKESYNKYLTDIETIINSILFI